LQGPSIPGCIAVVLVLPGTGSIALTRILYKNYELKKNLAKTTKS
jgi:hypothetical protein